VRCVACPLDRADPSGNHLPVIKKLLWFAGLLIALTTLTNVACGPKEKFCVDDPDNDYHCRPPQEEGGGFGGDGGQSDPCDGAGQVVKNGMLVCNF
jgi:hypothetical protein